MITNDEVVKILEICYPTWGRLRLIETMEAIMQEVDADKCVRDRVRTCVRMCLCVCVCACVCVCVCVCQCVRA